MLRRLLVLLLLSFAVVPAWADVPFWGAKTSSSADTLPSELKPGEWIWDSRIAASGPIVVVASLAEERAYVYRNGVIIGVSTTSSGKEGYNTPTGVFTILQKNKDHRSNI